MKLLGFNLTKIGIEKTKDVVKDLKIENKVDISEIKEVNQDILKSKDEVLAVKFTYIIDYSPGIAKVHMEGSILVSVESKVAKEVLKGWTSKDKNLPEEFRATIFNIIFRKAGLKAMELEDDMGLPLHIQMPSIRKKEKDSD